MNALKDIVKAQEDNTPIEHQKIKETKLQPEVP